MVVQMVNNGRWASSIALFPTSSHLVQSSPFLNVIQILATSFNFIQPCMVAFSISHHMDAPKFAVMHVAFTSSTGQFGRVV